MLPDDVQEFRNFLMDSVEQQFNNRSDLSTEEMQVFDDLTRFHQRVGSGRFTVTCICINCQNEVQTDDPFREIMLPIDVTDDTTLELLLQHNTTDSDRFANWLCTNCNNVSRAEKTRRISQYPDVLCIGLKRSNYVDGRIKRMNNNVDFPIKNLILQEDDRVTYDLIGGIFHKPAGGNSGHYIAICKTGNDSDSCWITYDDEEFSVNNFTKKNDPSKALKKFHKLWYLLFYERKSNFDTGDDRTISSIESMFSDISSTNEVNECIVLNENFNDNKNENASTPRDCLACFEPVLDDSWIKFGCQCS